MNFNKNSINLIYITFFQVIRSVKAENWTLQIKFVQLRDSGIYECQVNTEPKMSMAFRLNVVGKCPRIIRPILVPYKFRT